MRFATLVFVVLASTAHAQTPAAAPAPLQRHLVMPFENTTKEARGYWMSEGAAVALSDDLLALGVPAITREDRLLAFERLRVPSVAMLSHATVIRLGQVLGAGHVTIGSFELHGDDLTVRARTIRLDNGRMLPEIVERGDLKEFFAIYGRVARRMVPTSGVSTRELEQGHPPLTAFEQYIKGLVASAADTQIGFLTQALKQYPVFHRARLAF